MTLRSSCYAAATLLVPAMLVHMAACHPTNITSADGGFSSGEFSDGGFFDTGVGVGPGNCFGNGEGGFVGASVCTPDCQLGGSTCLAEGPFTGALRVSQLTPTLPGSLAQGVGRTLLGDAVMPNLPSCGLTGEETLSWLLQFDPSARTVKTGGARSASGAGGYTFVDETVKSGAASFHVAPITLQAPITTSCSFGSSVGQVVLPLYLSDTDVLLFPLHHLQFRTSAIAQDLSCIGQFNPGGFDEGNSCLPFDPYAMFFEPAGVDAWFDLEEADTVESETLGMSLCALLSGDPDTFGDGAQPVSHCKRDDTGAIVFKGDWCAAENHAATPTCADSLRFSATFAASGVVIQ